MKDTKYSKYRAPNGGFYEQNDIDYLVNNGYSVKSALEVLASSDKYSKKSAATSSKVKPSSGGSELGRAEKLAILAALGGAAALAAEEAYAQVQETGDIEVIDEVITEWEEEVEWEEVDVEELEVEEFEELEEYEEEYEESKYDETDLEIDEVEMDADEAEMDMDIEATEAEIEADEGYDDGGYDDGGDGGYDDGG